MIIWSILVRKNIYQTAMVFLSQFNSCQMPAKLQKEWRWSFWCHQCHQLLMMTAFSKKKSENMRTENGGWWTQSGGNWDIRGEILIRRNCRCHMDCLTDMSHGSREFLLWLISNLLLNIWRKVYKKTWKNCTKKMGLRFILFILYFMCENISHIIWIYHVNGPHI